MHFPKKEREKGKNYGHRILKNDKKNKHCENCPYLNDSQRLNRIGNYLVRFKQG